jgi:hypothetical protein
LTFITFSDTYIFVSLIVRDVTGDVADGAGAVPEGRG